MLPKVVSLCFRTNQFPPDIIEENFVHCENSSQHTSSTESKCSCFMLPQWILDKPDMIYPQNSIKKKGALGTGQFGTVHKGTYCQGNAV